MPGLLFSRSSWQFGVHFAFVFDPKSAVESRRIFSIMTNSLVQGVTESMLGILTAVSATVGIIGANAYPVLRRKVQLTSKRL